MLAEVDPRERHRDDARDDQTERDPERDLGLTEQTDERPEEVERRRADRLSDVERGMVEIADRAAGDDEGGQSEQRDPRPRAGREAGERAGAGAGARYSA